MTDNTSSTSDADDWASALAEQTAASAPAPLQAAAPAPVAAPAGAQVFQPIQSAPAGHTSPVDIDRILDMPVQLTVELGRTSITIKNLLQLAQGSVVELDGLAGEPMDVLVNGCLIAQGEVVVVNDKFGIRLTDIVTPSERIQKLNRYDSLRPAAALGGISSCVGLHAARVRGTAHRAHAGCRGRAGRRRRRPAAGRLRPAGGARADLRAALDGTPLRPAALRRRQRGEGGVELHGRPARARRRRGSRRDLAGAGRHRQPVNTLHTLPAQAVPSSQPAAPLDARTSQALGLFAQKLRESLGVRPK